MDRLLGTGLGLGSDGRFRSSSCRDDFWSLWVFMKEVGCSDGTGLENSEIFYEGVLK